MGVRDDRRAEGLCPDCGAEVVGPFIRCEACRRAVLEDRRATMTRRLLDECCVDCGAELGAIPAIRCEDCLTAMRVRVSGNGDRTRRYECTWCGKPGHNRRSCRYRKVDELQECLQHAVGESLLEGGAR